MAIGVKRLRQFQLGAEATVGAGATPTVVWRGLGTMEDTQTVAEVQEDIGIIGGVDNVYIPDVHATATMESVEATFEQLPYILEAGVKKVGTGAADGAGTDKIYAYPLSTTAQNTLQSYEIRAGDNNAVERMAYCLVSDFSIEGKIRDAIKMSGNWFGQQALPGSSFAAISVPATEVILMQKGVLYIDNVASGFGTTAITNTLVDFKLSVNTGATPVFTGDNNVLYYKTHKITDYEVMLDITFEHDANVTAEKVNWRAGTTRAVQLVFEGSAVGTGGTLYQNKTLVLNIPGPWMSFSAMTDNEGNNVVKATLKGKYNATLAQGPEIIVVNELVSLP